MARPARFPFRFKLTLLAAVLATGPLVVVGVMVVGVNDTAVTTGSRELQIALASDVARTVEAELTDARTGLVALAHTLTDASLDPDARLAAAAHLVESSATLDRCVVYDARGEVIDVLRQGDAAETPAAPLSAGLRAQADLDVAHGEPIASPEGPRVPLAVALRAGDRVTGYAASPVRLRRAQARVEELSEAHLSALGGRVFLVDAHSRLLAHPDAERAHGLVDVSDVGVLRGVDPETLGAPTSRELDVDGEALVGTVAPLRLRPWAVVVEIPRDAAYASLNDVRRIVGVTVTVTIALALLLSFLLADRITRPIGALAAFASDLAARRFDRRVTIDTQDELSQLGDAMSDAAAALERSEARVRQEEAIRADLGRYLPAELVDKIVSREQDMELGGRRLPITVLFADVVAFTPLTDKLPPEEVVALLNELFTLLTDIVFRHGGTVDKLIGDCVMAIWGAPSPQDDHAARALRAAEDMLRWLETANASWRERFGVTVQLGVGVNTGVAVVGNVGSERRMEYTAIGDVVNVAARLEVIARPQQILISRETKEAAGDGFDYVEVGARTVAGRAEPVHLFEVRA